MKHTLRNNLLFCPQHSKFYSVMVTFTLSISQPWQAVSLLHYIAVLNMTTQQLTYKTIIARSHMTLSIKLTSPLKTERETERDLKSNCTGSDEVLFPKIMGHIFLHVPNQTAVPRTSALGLLSN